MQTFAIILGVLVVTAIWWISAVKAPVLIESEEDDEILEEELEGWKNDVEEANNDVIGRTIHRNPNNWID